MKGLRIRHSLYRAAAMSALTASMAGCVVPSVSSSGKTRHYVILGFGVVSVPTEEAHTDATVSRQSSIGLMVSDQPGLAIAAGLSTSSVVSASQEVDDLLVEIAGNPFGDVTIQVNAHLEGETP